HEMVESVLAAKNLNELDRRSVEWHVALAARDDWAADEKSLSFLWWDDGYEVYGYGDSVLVDGYGGLAASLARDLDVRLGSPVWRIEWDAARPAKVHTERETFEADAVIVTVPLGVLQSGDMVFQPELPAAKRAAMSRLGMGNLTKVVLRYDQPFWPPDQYVFGYLCQ